jgi:hypothetical protein
MRLRRVSSARSAGTPRRTRDATRQTVRHRARNPDRPGNRKW